MQLPGDTGALLRCGARLLLPLPRSQLGRGGELREEQPPGPRVVTQQPSAQQHTNKGQGTQPVETDPVQPVAGAHGGMAHQHRRSRENQPTLTAVGGHRVDAGNQRKKPASVSDAPYAITTAIRTTLWPTSTSTGARLRASSNTDMTAYAAALAHFGPTSTDAPGYHTSAWPVATDNSIMGVELRFHRCRWVGSGRLFVLVDESCDSCVASHGGEVGRPF